MLNCWKYLKLPPLWFTLNFLNYHESSWAFLIPPFRLLLPLPSVLVSRLCVILFSFHSTHSSWVIRSILMTPLFMVDEVHTYLSAFNHSPLHFWMFIFWIFLWRGFIRHLILHILKMGCHLSAFTVWLSLWLINQDAQASILGVISDSSFSHTRDSQFTKSSQVNFLSLYISVSYCHHLTPGQHNFLPGIWIVNSPSIYYTQSSEMHSYSGYSMPQTFREASHCPWKRSTWYYLKLSMPWSMLISKCLLI